VRPEIEQEPLGIDERGGVPAGVRRFLVHHGAHAFGMQPVRGTKAGHARAEYDDAIH
jgi:hypothetical protein